MPTPKQLKNLILGLALLISAALPMLTLVPKAAATSCGYAACTDSDVRQAVYVLNDYNDITVAFPGPEGPSNPVFHSDNPATTHIYHPTDPKLFCTPTDKNGSAIAINDSAFFKDPSTGSDKFHLEITIPSGGCHRDVIFPWTIRPAGYSPSGGGSGSGGSSSSGDPNCNTSSPTENSLSKCINNNPIVSDLNTIVNFLGGIVGIVIIGSIIVGGIQYITAGDNSTLITAGKQRVMKSIIALVIFIFTYAFLQWLIPGGVFK